MEKTAIASYAERGFQPPQKANSYPLCIICTLYCTCLVFFDVYIVAVMMELILKLENFFNPSYVLNSNISDEL